METGCPPELENKRFGLYTKYCMFGYQLPFFVRLGRLLSRTRLTRLSRQVRGAFHAPRQRGEGGLDPTPSMGGLETKGIATTGRSKKLLVAPGHTTSNKKLRSY